MKNFLAALFFLSAILNADAQYPKLIVQLKDKGSNTFSLSNPSQFLSARALQRRSRFSIAFDSSDLPVTQLYIDSLKSVPNVTVLSVSKWLNQVLIATTDANAVNTINSFPFVKASMEIGNRHIGMQPKFKEMITPLNSSSHRTSGTDSYSYGSSYNQVHIHEGEYLHNKGFHGENMVITVLDAGFRQYKTITAFDSVRMNGQILGERDFVDYDNSVNEDDTHGMNCLSTMAANWPNQMVGTAPKASYWLVRTEQVASEFPVEEHNWVVGAEFADSVGTDLISSSLGYNTFDDPAFNHTYNDLYANTAMSSKGAAFAARKGIIVMNSAGNEGGNSWKYLSFPADADSVCAVGAVNSTGNIAGFSSYGYPGKIKPNIVSIGVNTTIASTNNVPSSGSGTSFSNPNIAGLIACLWQAFPGRSNMQILDAVYKSADRYSNPDNRYGFGIPNFRLACDLLDTGHILGLDTIIIAPKDTFPVSFSNDWLVAVPNPFRNNLKVYLKAPETGKVNLRLVDAIGRTVDMLSFEASVSEVYTLSFNNTSGLPAGVYNLQYVSSTQKRVKRVLKL